MKHPRLPVPAGDGPPYVRARKHRPGLATAVHEAHAAAMALSAVDAVTTELVRLRCAGYQDCRT